MSMNVVEIRNNLADTTNRVAYAGERIILERRGKGEVATVSMDDLTLLDEMEERSDSRAAKKALNEKGGVSLEKIKVRLGMS